ncbi:MAG TPA: phosphoglucosamine mutase [Planctomycetota bacterium]|nr:phosphoglucosamine mutase [Planctomycetota bacterium]
MDSLMIGVSGVRGVIGSSLTPELVIRFSMAFGTYMKGGTVVVGRDTRKSGAMVKHSVFAGLMASGCTIIDVGVATTPSCSLSIVDLKAAGGIVISGSHNPAEWNALKFFKHTGICLNDGEAAELLDIYYQGNFRGVAHDKLKPERTDDAAGERHLNRVLAVTAGEPIHRRRPRVVLDACNGAGSLITPKLLQALGCEAVKIHCDPNEPFPHNPEPIFVHLGDLCRKVVEVQADVGFAQDADADRMAIVDETGHFIGEEYSLALATAAVLPKRPGKVVMNLSTSRMSEDVARRFDCEVIRTKVGEVNVAERMMTERAVIGGEGNGGVIDPRIHYGRDSLSGIAMLLQYMSESGRKMSELVAEIPHYHMKKTKIACTRDVALELVHHICAEHAGERVNTEDGVRIDWDDAWVHVRPSATEPAVRIIAEAQTQQRVDQLCDTFAQKARALLDQ